MRFRTTLILIILLAVIVLVIQQIGDREEPAPAGPEPLLPGVNFGSVDRIECAKVDATTNRLKESIQKFKVSGRTLESMQRVYLFCEIER
mgnify:CR=1 FL=1